MQQNKQDQRRQQIRTAAYELLEEKGYKATSMLAIAKRAKASNETLYSWYGNKQTLFSTLIQENASEVASALNIALSSGADFQATLSRVGPLLLQLVTSDKAIILSRAAAADVSDTGVLGESLAQLGRDTVAPLLQKVFTQARTDGILKFKPSDNVTEVYLGLLIGDTQIRRATGALKALTRPEVNSRANRALKLFMQLYSA
ncbi:hypothetical protein AB833_24955 [Chromatiales bacterium (ex Bugula neritina AB1)]|nr:hypothetical protein AB833_24955 [Chromatiales bacterium (ex Bugula neritina AB1)]